jgi:hypothetical protein
VKYIKLFENYKSDEEIHVICKEYGIENYTINNGVVDVNGDVHLDHRGLTKIPLNFGVVSGDFYCYNNKLTSLEGCPSQIGGNFRCDNNPVHNIWKLISSDDKFNSEIIDLFNDYDPIREDGIILDRLNDFLKAIGKEPVGGVVGYEIID